MRRVNLNKDWMLTGSAGVQTDLPAQVHDVLLENGCIEKSEYYGIEQRYLDRKRKLEI